MKKQDLINYLKKQKEVIAIGETGSVGREYNDKYSDIDLFVVADDKKSSGNLKKKYGKLDVEKHPYQEIFKNLNLFSFKIGSTPASIRTFDKSEIVNILKKGSLSDLSVYLYDLKILYDTKCFFRDLKKKTKFPKEKSKFELRVVVYPLRINHFVGLALKRKDYIYLNDILNQTIIAILKVLYSLNNKLYVYPKWAFKDIRKFKIKPENLENRMNKVIFLRNNGGELKKKVKILNQIGLDLLEIISKKNPNMAKQIKEHVEWVK